MNRPTEDQLVDMVEDMVNANILNEYERLNDIIEAHPKMNQIDLHHKFMTLAFSLIDLMDDEDADPVDVGIQAIAAYTKFIKEHLEP